ncbi:hypothetical protein BH10PLA1_BH10PLA1_11580 [soil metagenome]
MSNVSRDSDIPVVIPPGDVAPKGNPAGSSMLNPDLLSGSPALESNFAIFGMMFAVWVLIDQSFFPQWMNAYPSLFTAPLAAMVLLRPNSVRLFLVMMLASLWSFWWKSPYNVNNVFIGGFFASLILMGAAIYIVKNRHLPASLGELERGSFPAMRVGVIGIFAFAVLHKSNMAFLDPRMSCAVIHTERLLKLTATVMSHLGLGSLTWMLPSIKNPAVAVGSIHLTLATEAAIPIILALGWMRFPSRKLITFGIIFALGFHFVMSFNGYQNFSVMAVAYYVPFLPVGFYRSVSNTIARLKRGAAANALRAMMYMSALAVVVFATELFLFAVIKIARPGVTLRGEKFLRQEGWLLFNFGVAPAVALIFCLISYIRRREPNQLGGTKLPLWTAIPLFVVVLNSMSPYLGLKTENSFAMFSNLLTEGDISHWNHAFLPPSMRVFHFQDNLVMVQKTSLDPKSKVGALQDGKFEMVEFEFKREMANACKHIAEPIEIDYTINGVPHHVADAHLDPYMTEGNGAILEKLMYFRLVPNSPYGICLH